MKQITKKKKTTKTNFIYEIILTDFSRCLFQTKTTTSPAIFLSNCADHSATIQDTGTILLAPFNNCIVCRQNGKTWIEDSNGAAAVYYAETKATHTTQVNTPLCDGEGIKGERKKNCRWIYSYLVFKCIVNIQQSTV